MKTLGALARITLVLALVTGCAHWPPWKPRQPQAPPLQTGQGSLDKEQEKNKQPAPPSTLPQPSASAQTTPPELPAEKPPKVKRSRKKRHPESGRGTAGQQPSATATSSLAPNLSPIGQLSTGDSATGAQTKRDTLSLISQTEEGLAKLKPHSSKEDLDTQAQIRTFLVQAKQALDSGDTDGAHTLATKAKLLLDELTKQ